MAKRAQQGELPEMEIAKDSAMSRFCKRIAEHRITINEATASEKADKAGAMKRMMDLKIDEYTQHGVRLTHNTNDTLTVKLVDDAKGDAGEQGDLDDVE